MRKNTEDDIGEDEMSNVVHNKIKDLKENKKTTPKEVEIELEYN